MTTTASNSHDVDFPSQTISIMPDFGMSPYAWIKSSADESEYVGVNVGSFHGKPVEFPITDELHANFISWCAGFEVNEDMPDFNWAEFHDRGVALARQLKQQVGDDFRVLYVKPVEDPNRYGIYQNCAESPVL